MTPLTSVPEEDMHSPINVLEAISICKLVIEHISNGQ